MTHTIHTTTSRRWIAVGAWLGGRLGAYVGLVSLAGLIALAYALTSLPHGQLWLLLPLVIASALIEAAPIPLLGTALRAASLSVASAISLAALFVGGPAGAVLVNLGSASMNSLYPQRRPLFKVAFNTATLLLSALAAGAVYRLSGGSSPITASMPDIAAAVLAALAYYLVNTTLINGAISLSTGQPFRAVRDHWQWLTVQYGTTFVVGLTMALAYLQLGLGGLIVFSVPLVLPWYSTRLYVGKSKQVAEQNEALQATNQELAASIRQLEERNREMTLLVRLGELLQSSLTMEEAYTIIAQYAQQLFPGLSGTLAVFRNSRDQIEAVATWGEAGASEPRFAPEACWALRSGRIHEVAAGAVQPLCRHVHQPVVQGYFCVPMVAHGEIVGLLHFQDGAGQLEAREQQPEVLTESKRQVALALAEQGALALSNLKLRETLRLQATRDALTGLFNRRYMEESLERELHRARRTSASVGVIMFDIDHFKHFNDSYGHAAGDTLLCALGHFLRTHLRGADIACRFGGEEFTLILPDTSLDATRDCAERLRQGVKALQIEHRGQLLRQVTISVGVAAFPQHGTTVESLLQVADDGLYSAKAAGRDRVVVA